MLHKTSKNLGLCLLYIAVSGCISSKGLSPEQKRAVPLSAHLSVNPEEVIFDNKSESQICAFGYENEDDNKVWEQRASCTINRDSPFSVYVAGDSIQVDPGNRITVCIQAFDRNRRRNLFHRNGLCKSKEQEFLEWGPVDIPAGSWRLHYFQINQFASTRWVRVSLDE